MTVKVRPDVPSLRSVRVVREIERSFRSACDRGDFRLVHYSLLRTHAHLVVEAADAVALARGMKAIGARLARAVNRVFGRRGPVLAERFHLRVLRTPLEVRRALAHVLLNARRRTAPGGRDRSRVVRPLVRGLVAAPPGTRSGPAAAAVARPYTWLLRAGWRRHGLIDPNEVPGGR